MSDRIGLVGFVNTDEILADVLKQQTPDVIVDGYEVIPNEAFGRAVDNRHVLYGLNEAGEFGFHHLDKLHQIPQLGYAAVNLGPIPAAFIAGSVLDETGYDYIGPRRNELIFETDKTKIEEIFPASSGILPPTEIIESTDFAHIQSVIDAFEGKVVVKFVGEYNNHYKDSETRRVRMLSEFKDADELIEFVGFSIGDSGKVILQKFVEGQQFSYTCMTDGNGNIFALGENICFKHRNDGEEGPLCDGTGALSVNNTLPWVLGEADLTYIRTNIVQPYVEHVGSELGRAPKTFLNLDLIKGEDGRVYLLEVNHREPGGHTMANLVGGLKTPLVEVFQAAQAGRLNELTPRFKKGASVIVSAYPANFPFPFPNDEARTPIIIPKLKRDDLVRIYTGWVEVLSETENSVIARPQLSPTMLFANHADSIDAARQNVYKRISEVVPSGYAFRTDIGLNVGK